MPAKKILFRAEAREKVLRGSEILADTVRGTLGPRAHSVLIARKWGRPQVCDDGVTIVKEVVLEDPVMDLGAQAIKEAAEQNGNVDLASSGLLGGFTLMTVLDLALG